MLRAGFVLLALGLAATASVAVPGLGGWPAYLSWFVAGIGMGLAIAGLASKEGVEVEDLEAASVSYPGFLRDLASISCR